MDQGGLGLNRGPTDLADLAAEALGTVDLGDRNVSLLIPATLSANVDRRRMLRVLTNLLSNVVRYTPADTTVEITAAADGTGVALTVADRGPGVPDAALPRLFDPFYRTEQSRSRRTGGLGLGLMLVRQIVEAHGGSVQAENRAGGGLAVHLRLPL